MEDDVAVRLKNWADEMGYVHPFGNSADFNKLCKNKTTSLWDKTISRVKPLDKLDHIRKNILLSRIRSGTNVQSSAELSGSLGRQFKLKHELKQLVEQKQSLLDKISAEEAAIMDIQQDMKKKYAQKIFMQNQLKEAQLKAEMLRIKRRDCESFKSWLDDVQTTAKSLCPSKAESSAQATKDMASPALQKAIKIVQDYQTWCKESSRNENILPDEDYQLEQEQRKLALWKAFTAIMGKIPPEEVWNSLLSNFMEKSVSEMASLASSVDMKAELDKLREASTNGAKPNQELSAMYIKSMVDTADHLVKAQVLSRKLDQILEQKASDAEASILTEMNMTKSSQSMRDRILDRARLRCRLVQLEAAKKALTDEVAEMKLKTRDLSSCAQRLKEEKAVVARLDSEIAEVKLAVEQGLLSISGIENKLRKAQQGVIDELDSFAVKCSAASDVISSSSCDGTLNSTHSSMHSSVLPSSSACSTEVSFMCSTPSAVKSNLHELFCMDESGLTIGKVESVPPKISFRDIVSALRNALSNESKSFFKLPLDLVPRVKLSTTTGDISSLLSESPALIARLSCAGEGLKQLVHCSPAPMVIDSQLMLRLVFQNLGHVRALQLQRLVSECPSPTTLCAGVSQQYLQTTAPVQDTNIREKLSNIFIVIENIEGGIVECRQTFDDWVRRPVQGMLPSSLQVDGKSFKEWKDKYDSWLLNHSESMQ